jgi:hypothetical protein
VALAVAMVVGGPEAGVVGSLAAAKSFLSWEKFLSAFSLSSKWRSFGIKDCSLGSSTSAMRPPLTYLTEREVTVDSTREWSKHSQA